MNETDYCEWSKRIPDVVFPSVKEYVFLGHSQDAFLANKIQGGQPELRGTQL